MDGAALSVSITALLITCLGWVVTYLSSARTQRRMLINSLTNEARESLTDAIRDCQEWCSELLGTGDSMAVDEITSGGLLTDHHDARKRRLWLLSVDPRRIAWLRRLEEYEPLFSDTGDVRVELLQMTETISDLTRKLAKEHSPGSPPLPNAISAFNTEIFDLLSVSWDLLVHIQNSSIGKLTGKSIKKRAPLNPNSTRLEVTRWGTLRLIRTEIPHAALFAAPRDGTAEGLPTSWPP